MNKFTQFITGKKPAENPNNPIPAEKIKTKVAPATRSSEGPSDNVFGLGSYSFDKDESLVKPGYQFEVIEVIRKMTLNNQSVSQALSNIVNLANTGFKLVFDAGVKAEQIDEMRDHLNEVSQHWHYGSAGLHGIVNKMFSQAMIAGAICVEKIPNDDFTGIYRVMFPRPETIRFIYNRPKLTYFPYQKLKNPLAGGLDAAFGGLKPLNIHTFKYIAINGDLEEPYGIPPYLPAMGPLEDQKVMLENIKWIIRQIGIVGFLQLMVEKPGRNDGEAETTYKARLTSYLNECKDSIKASMRDGIVVGYQDDHEFDFQSVTKNASGVEGLFSMNEMLVSQSLKQDAALSGKGGGGAETAVTILFNKLLAELNNIQISVAEVLKDLITFEFKLAGFKFKKLSIVFNPSTIQDDLKMMQGEEIKIRNNRQLRMDGIIDQDQYADNMGYQKPAQQEPVVPFMPDKTTGDPNLDAQKKQVREKSKDVSDKRSRDRGTGGQK